MRLPSLAACLISLSLISACNLASPSRVQATRRLNEGIEQIKKNNLQGAERAFQDAIKTDPKFSAAYYNLGKVHYKQGHWADAAKTYEDAIKALENPNASYHYELGLAHEQMGLAAAGRDERIGQFREAIRAYEAALQINAADYKASYHAGTLYEKLDEPEKADGAYRKAIDVNSQYSPSFVSLGNMYIDYGHPNVALAVLDVGTKVNAADAGMWNGLGRARLNMNDAKGAVEAYQKAKAIDPEMPDVLFGLGMAFAEMGNRKDAIESLSQFQQKAGTGAPEHIMRSAQNTLARMQNVI